jgi:hypothetical protein
MVHQRERKEARRQNSAAFASWLRRARGDRRRIGDYPKFGVKKCLVSLDSGARVLPGRGPPE